MVVKFLVCFCCCLAVAASSVATAESQLFVVVADLHLDPLMDPVLYNESTYCRAPGTPLARVPDAVREHFRGFPSASSTGSAFGRYGCDSPVELVDGALDAAAKLLSGSASVVLFNGDAAAHCLDDASHDAAWDTVHKLFAKHFPGSTIEAALGNNDLHGDYNADCSSAELAALATKWKAWGWLQSEDAVASFKKMGAFSHAALPGLRVVILNTNVFSVSARRSNASSTDCGQLAWLDSQLSDAKRSGESVWIVGHIPPAIDTFSKKALWEQQYADAYRSILSKHDSSGVLQASFFGHVHKDEFRLLPGISCGGLTISPAVSPVFGNNPAVRIGKTTSNAPFVPLDLTNSFLDLRLATTDPAAASWTTDSSFGEAFDLPDVSAKSLAVLSQSVERSSATFATWRDRSFVHHNEEDRGVVCTLQASSLDDFNRCVEKW